MHGAEGATLRTLVEIQALIRDAEAVADRVVVDATHADRYRACEERHMVPVGDRNSGGAG